MGKVEQQTKQLKSKINNATNTTKGTTGSTKPPKRTKTVETPLSYVETVAAVKAKDIPAKETTKEATKNTSTHTPKKPAHTENTTNANRRIVVNRTKSAKTELSLVDLATLHDTINTTLTSNNNSKHIVIAQVKQTLKENLLLITREDSNSAQAMPFRKSILKTLTKWDTTITDLKEDTCWGKMLIHAINVKQYGSEEGMKKLRSEIEKHNLDVMLMQDPRWLTSDEKRKDKKMSSVVVAVRDEASTVAIAKCGIVIMGIMMKTVVFNSCKPTDQCQNCQRYGHHHTKCAQPTRCRLCSKGYSTNNHKCAKCHSTTNCEHMTPKCSNCKGSHKVNDRTCPTLITITTRKEKTKQVTEEKTLGEMLERQMSDDDKMEDDATTTAEVTATSS